MFDLRPLYAFDASEGQIPEGAVSVYGPANSHANCVPASFTAALDLLGLGDIDPQRVTNEIYGPNYRGGFGNFQRMIAWVATNVPGAPSFTDEPFNFDRAEAAGQNGQLIIVAGWIVPSSVTFAAQSVSGGFSHASLLVAHLAGDKYVIWNTWFGQMQTYDRAVLAASLYEMSITAGAHGGGAGSLSGGFGTLTDIEIQARFVAVLEALTGLRASTDAIDGAMFYPESDPKWGTYSALLNRRLEAAAVKAAGGSLTAKQEQNLQEAHDAVQQLVASRVADQTAMLAAINALKGSQAIASDPALLAAVQAISKHVGVGTP